MQYFISAEHGISDFYFCRRITNGSNPASIHSHIELIFLLDGEMSVTIDRNTHILHKNEVIIIMPYEVHSYTTEESSDVFIIACPPDYMNEHKQMLTKKLFVPPITDFDKCTTEIIESIVKNDMKDDLKKKALLYYALSGFLEKCEAVDKETYEFDTYRKAIAYISTHYSEDITLSGTAQQIGVSASHLSRVLNQRGSSGFTEILNSLRIYNAKRLLEQTELSVSDAAYESGYGSIRNFNRIFKRYFGVSPNQLRRE